MTHFRYAVGLAAFFLALSASVGAQTLEPDHSGSRATNTAPSLSSLQYVGTHNSYHVEQDQAVKQLMLESGYAESDEWPADKLVRALSFTHPSIADQLDMGLRLFEFDMHDDPAGGRYANPGILAALSSGGVHARLDADTSAILAEPGIKVFHTADTDIKSRCLTLVRCLTIIRDWSAAHPDHVPIIIQLETKESRKPAVLDAYQPADVAPFGDGSWARLHREIGLVFDADKIVLPREVQGDFASLNAAVRSRGWPSLDTLKGRVIFMLLDAPEKQRAYLDYAARHAADLVLFPSIDHRDPDTAWLIHPNPKDKNIRRRVREGFLVYTRADTHTAQARNHDYSRRDRAFASGAQLVSTDFPKADPRYSDYAVSIRGRYVGCNGGYQKDACLAFGSGAR